MDSASGSITRLKIDGERGQPWRVPLVIGKCLERRPDVRTLADGLEYRAIIADRIGPLNPNLVSTATMYPQ